MLFRSKKLSEIPQASNVASTDRVLVLRDPSGNASTRTVTVNNFTNSLRYANTTVSGLVKVGNNLSINSTGYISGTANTGNVTFSNAPYYSGQQITSADPLILRGNNYVTSVVNDSNTGFAELWWHNRDLELGNASNNTSVDADLYVENDGMWLYVGGLDNSNTFYNHQWHWGMDGILDIPSGGDIRRDGVSVLNPPRPTPNIEYTGVFNGYPDTLPVTTGKNVIYTANGTTVSNSNLYWWDDQFYDGNYDLSGTTTITLTNIGGLTGQVSFGNKTLNLLTNVNLDQVAYTSNFYTTNMPALDTFSAGNLAHINNNFRIYSMDKAETVFDFSNLRYVSNCLQFDYNDVLTTFPSFPELKHIFYIYINNNDALNNNALEFPALTYLSYMYFYNNGGIVYGPSFPNLTTTGYIYIVNNPNMFYAPKIGRAHV